jgi:hypothetical protein
MNDAQIISAGDTSRLAGDGRVHDQLLAMFVVCELFVYWIIDSVECLVGSRYILDDWKLLQKFLLLLEFAVMLCLQGVAKCHQL